VFSNEASAETDALLGEGAGETAGEVGEGAGETAGEFFGEGAGETAGEFFDIDLSTTGAAETAAETAGEAVAETAAEAGAEVAAEVAAEAGAELVAEATLGEAIVAAAGASSAVLLPVAAAAAVGYGIYELGKMTVDALTYDDPVAEPPPPTLDEIVEQSRAQKAPEDAEWKNSEADEAPQYDAYWAPYATKGREANTPGDAHWDQSVVDVAQDGTVTYGAHSYVPGAKNFDATTAVPQAVANDADAPAE
jgi:hypothetical protein